MYFRFGSALVLIVCISLAGVALEKRNLELRREVTRQHYRTEVLLEKHARLRAETQQLGAPTRTIENHKDLRSEDLLQLIDRIQSEYIGVCVDLGNSCALMEDPVDIARAFSKVAYSCHIKDHILKSYNKGFLLFDAKLGTGVINLQQAVSTLRQAPSVRPSVETYPRL